MPSSYTLADLMDHGFDDPVIARSLALENGSVVAPERVPEIFKRAVSRAARGSVSASFAATLKRLKRPLEIAAALIQAKYRALGAEKGVLGAPMTTVRACADQRGYVRVFARGVIYWCPATGAHEVHGDILIKYRELGAERSVLGYPITDERGTPDNEGRYNHFQAGSIYWTPRTSAHEVHGLIRRLWAEQGWERNAELGYPISDELIPNRAIGFSRPIPTGKIRPGVPADLIRFPAEALTPGMHVAPSADGHASRKTNAGAPAILNPLGTPTLGPIPDPILFGPNILNHLLSSVSEAAKEKAPSRNRYGDFENGVLFWKRGTDEAVQLRPWLQTAAGARMRLSAQEVVALAGVAIRASISRLGIDVLATAFAGTAPYSYDGAGVRNRRHRIQTQLFAAQQKMQGAVEIQVEASFDPIDRRVVGCLAGWHPLSAPTWLVRQLHSLLDTSLWKSFPLLAIPDQDGAPLPVLSVKTMADGDVSIFIEP